MLFEKYVNQAKKDMINHVVIEILSNNKGLGIWHIKNPDSVIYSLTVTISGTVFACGGDTGNLMFRPQERLTLDLVANSHLDYLYGKLDNPYRKKEWDSERFKKILLDNYDQTLIDDDFYNEHAAHDLISLYNIDPEYLNSCYKIPNYIMYDLARVQYACQLIQSFKN